MLFNDLMVIRTYLVGSFNMHELKKRKEIAAPIRPLIFNNYCQNTFAHMHLLTDMP